MIQSIDQYQVDAMLEGKDGVYFSQHLKHPFIQAIKKKYQDIGFHSSASFSTHDDVPFDKFTVWYQPAHSY